jgi:hypothetical protein
MNNLALRTVRADDTFSLSLEVGLTVHNVGDGHYAIDQIDGDTKAPQRVIVTHEALEAVLA